MATKIFVGPYVHGPEPNSTASNADAGGRRKSWFKAFLESLTRQTSINSANGDQAGRAASRSDATDNHWAYRVTNYVRLRAAGLTCLIAPPNSAAGISSHLDLEAVEPTQLREADIFLVESGQFVPADGVILEGIATIDESPIAGQSCPVLRSPEGSGIVMRECRVVEGQIIVQVSPRPGPRLDWIDNSAQMGGRPPAKLPSRSPQRIGNVRGH